MWFSLKRSSDQDKKKSSLNRTGFCLRAGRKPIGSFLSDLCYFVPYSRMSFKWTLQSRWLCLWCRSAFSRKKNKTKKNANCPRFWRIMVLSHLRLLPHFCSLPVMGFNGLTQFTNMDILDKECIQVYKIKGNNSNLDE